MDAAILNSEAVVRTNEKQTADLILGYESYRGQYRRKPRKGLCMNEKDGEAPSGDDSKTPPAPQQYTQPFQPPGGAWPITGAQSRHQ